jgi:hypothetical protein
MGERSCSKEPPPKCVAWSSGMRTSNPMPLMTANSITAELVRHWSIGVAIGVGDTLRVLSATAKELTDGVRCKLPWAHCCQRPRGAWLSKLLKWIPTVDSRLERVARVVHPVHSIAVSPGQEAA